MQRLWVTLDTTAPIFCDFFLTHNGLSSRLRRALGVALDALGVWLGIRDALGIYSHLLQSISVEAFIWIVDVAVGHRWFWSSCFQLQMPRIQRVSLERSPGVGSCFRASESAPSGCVVPWSIHDGDPQTSFGMAGLKLGWRLSLTFWGTITASVPSMAAWTAQWIHCAWNLEEVQAATRHSLRSRLRVG